MIMSNSFITRIEEKIKEKNSNKTNQLMYMQLIDKILTEKTKEDFLKEFYGEITINEKVLYIHIIDWLDLKKFIINIKSKFGKRKQCERFSFLIRTYNSGFIFNSRTEAIKEAISKANYFYNRSITKKNQIENV